MVLQAPASAVPVQHPMRSSAWLALLMLAAVLALMLYPLSEGRAARGVVLLLMVLVWTVAMLGQTHPAARRLTGASWAVLSGLMLWEGLALADPWAWASPLATWLSLTLGLVMVHLLARKQAKWQGDFEQQAQALSVSMHKITQLATHDELTGLSNRRHMADLMAREQQRQRRSRAPMCMAMLDLDHFKRVNDAHGHAAGDEVLKIFARTLRQTLRTTDEISRWGGEEFLLLMPHTCLQEAQWAVERLRQVLATTSLAPLPLSARVTFSAGIVQAPEGADLDAVIACADEAMYCAKMKGRDCAMAKKVEKVNSETSVLAEEPRHEVNPDVFWAVPKLDGLDPRGRLQ